MAARLSCYAIIRAGIPSWLDVARPWLEGFTADQLVAASQPWLERLSTGFYGDKEHPALMAYLSDLLHDPVYGHLARLLLSLRCAAPIGPRFATRVVEEVYHWVGEGEALDWVQDLLLPHFQGVNLCNALYYDDDFSRPVLAWVLGMPGRFAPTYAFDLVHEAISHLELPPALEAWARALWEAQRVHFPDPAV